MLKEHGLNAEHSMQFILCVRSTLHFGLWWQVKLSETQWAKLEKCWNNMVRTALHEKCPKSLPIEKLREISGIPGIREFSEYLMHLRMNKISAPGFTKCSRFTLNFSEFVKIRTLFIQSTSSKTRKSTQRRTADLTLKLRREQLLKSFGPIRAHLFMLGEKYKWRLADFSLCKEELQIKYKVKNVGIHSDYVKLRKHELIEKLISLCPYCQFE